MMGYTNLFSASFCSTPLPLYCASALNSNKVIGPAANFWSIPNTATLGTLVRSFKSEAPPNNFVGQWNNLSDRFIGLRFFGGDGLYHYGWIRLDVSKAPASITVKDYGYESQGEISIVAGDMGNVGVPGISSSHPFDIFNEGSVVNVLIKDRKLGGAKLVIANMLGQVVYTKQFLNDNMKINLNSFEKGVLYSHHIL
jgi:hypothetical protein